MELFSHWEDEGDLFSTWKENVRKMKVQVQIMKWKKSTLLKYTFFKNKYYRKNNSYKLYFPLLTSLQIRDFTYKCQSSKDFKYAVTADRPPLWSSGQSSWLQIQRSEFDSRCYQIFWEVAGLERGPLSLVSTTEELLRRKGSSSGLESREYSCMDLSRWPCGTLYPQKLALTSLTSDGHLVCIFRSWTQAMEV
jgi:hypothetical protein